MNLPIHLISTDFDGTLFAEFENPPIPKYLQQLIGGLQARGVKWVINTGRDMSALMEALARSKISIHPDYLVLVEREIYIHQDSRYVGVADWNDACTADHESLFKRVRADLPRLISWVNARFNATVYEDAYSPFCILAADNTEAEGIYRYMEEYCEEVPGLKVVRNDVYARFCHAKYNKGTALAEICRRLNIHAENTLAAGDHLNDLPMLTPEYARYLVAPNTAVDAVKEAVRDQNGFVSDLPQGHGVTQGLKHFFSVENFI